MSHARGQKVDTAISKLVFTVVGARGRAFRLKAISRALLGIFFIATGANHFVSPAPYLAIIPPSLPWPGVLVALTGLAEIAGGSGVVFARTRKVAAFGLMALLIAVFPANIYAALYGMQLSGRPVASWILWLRLPLQPLLIWWVYNACWKARELPR